MRKLSWERSVTQVPQLQMVCSWVASPVRLQSRDTEPLGQWFSKCGLRPPLSPGNLPEIHDWSDLAAVAAELLNQKPWGWGPAVCFNKPSLTSPPGDSAAKIGEWLPRAPGECSGVDLASAVEGKSCCSKLFWNMEGQWVFWAWKMASNCTSEKLYEQDFIHEAIKTVDL